MPFRISVDTGGTFTDVVVADEAGKLHIGKSLTTPERAFTGVSASIADAARQIGVSFEDLVADTSLFIYGTTRATNAIVERKTAKTAFLTTAGFPDILLFKEGGKLDGHRWDIDFPKPYVPRRHTFEVAERITSEGTIATPLDEEALRGTLRVIRKRGFEAVAVCLLWSVENPVHEKRIGELIEAELPGVPFTLSHELNPILREYRRASSTVIDASLAPLMRRHLGELKQDLFDAGFAGQLLVATSIGGVMHVEDAMKRPIYLTKSGPAMAPVAGHLYASAERLADSVIVCDAGGTTFDVSLVNKGEIKFSRDTWIGPQFSGDCVGLSSVDVRSIGSGGGSIAWIDNGGLLRVGPHSAGSVPGPACYGRGGTEATVTDAALALGYVDPDYFLGGRMKLDVEAARTAIARLAAQLGQEVETAAAGILAIANEHMVRAIQELTINEGYDPSRSTMIAGGGSCGFSIMSIARTLGCSTVILPRTASALSACGAQYSDFAFEATAACAARSDRFDYEKVNATLAELEAKVEKFGETLAQRGVSSHRVTYSVEARYQYEAWELEVAAGRSRFDGPEDVTAFVERFHAEHERVFAVRQEDQPVEMLSWKARYAGQTDIAKPAAAAISSFVPATPAKHRRAYFTETGFVDLPVFFGADLVPGNLIAGPAVIEEPTTTVVVYPGMQARIGGSGSYLLEATNSSSTTAVVARSQDLDQVTLAVMANRLDGIVREMSNTLLRAGRSAVINQARDFSCSIVTGNNELLAVAEGVPVHVFGSHIQTASVSRFHQPREGDAYLHNDPYLGNTHPADHTIIVPVFFEGELLFYTVAKAHQADIGNANPTTYAANAIDVYNEGALIFPCVKVHSGYREIDDIVRMCRARIRVPDQWYGDFLAAVGAARIGERKLKEFAAQYGTENVAKFIRQWFGYSERRMASAIAKLPSGTVAASTRHDPTPAVPEGIPVKVEIEVDARNGRISIDLTDNPDCYDCGLNESEACSTSAVMTGLFNCLDWDIPKNAGSFRCVEIKLRENCVVGIPRFPHSCSMATTNLADRLVNVTQSAFAGLGQGHGMAEGGNAMGAPMGVVSGIDRRNGGEPYINQIFVGKNGGPGGPLADGWVTYVLPNAGGVTYRDSIELDELKHPLHIHMQRLAVDTGGVGHFRGAPAAEVVYGPKFDPMTVVIPSDGQHFPPQGVLGGGAGSAGRTYRVTREGERQRLPNVCTVELQPGELIHGIDCGGGGYGSPLERDPHRVLNDLLEGWISAEAASELYGVVCVATDDDGGLAVDARATEAKRNSLRAIAA
ncbi:hydantoinase B/oxoprolinase family protein [Pseudaminobacter salicylatoxidans]|uniref:hydantoinase B/oxoprolinase family protein n=1 Tax=Pseudaminobacter salicylatoxidans TaxID=93369 RepID=UPI000307FEF8|nr:hydantoinase B/oxoprolinase family protein [Pseudaminobacter salicylatoxidans]